MKENKSAFAQEDNNRKKQQNNTSSPSQREQLAEEGPVKRALNAESYDDDYEAGEEDEIIEEEGRTEKDNFPGKS